jgi:DNA-binding transcriptional LysR family regulator
MRAMVVVSHGLHLVSTNMYILTCLLPLVAVRARRNGARLKRFTRIASADGERHRRGGNAAWSLYASEAYLRCHPAPTDPRHLKGHKLMGFDRKLAGVPSAQWIERHGRGATVVQRSVELSDMLAAAHNGMGLAVLPCMLAETEPSLKRLTPEVLGRHSISLIYRREMLLVDAVRKVIDFVVTAMQEKADLVRSKR